MEVDLETQGDTNWPGGGKAYNTGRHGKGADEAANVTAMRLHCGRDATLSVGGDLGPGASGARYHVCLRG